MHDKSGIFTWSLPYFCRRILEPLFLMLSFGLLVSSRCDELKYGMILAVGGGDSE